MLISLTRTRPVLHSHRLVLPLPSARLHSSLHLTHQRQRTMAETARTTEELNQEIAQQSALLNDLRKQQADASTVEEVKKKLGELKRTLGQLAGGAKESGKKKERILLKTAKVGATFVKSSLPTYALVRAHATMAPEKCTAESTLNGSSRIALRRLVEVVLILPFSREKKSLLENTVKTQS